MRQHVIARYGESGEALPGRVIIAVRATESPTRR